LLNIVLLRNSLVLFFLLATLVVRAEYSGGIAQLRAEPDGEAVLEIKSGTAFIAHPFNARLSRVWLELWVKKDGQYDEIQLKRGAVLYDANGKKVGRVIRPFNPIQEFPHNDTLVKIWIDAYLEHASIDIISVAEAELQKLLMVALPNSRQEFFQSFLDTFKLQEMPEQGDYKSFLLNDFDFQKREFRPRLLLIFYRNELIAVFHHRPLKAKVYDSIETGGAFGMIYNSKFSENSKATLMQIYKSKFR